MNPKVQCTSDIAKNSFGSIEVRSGRMLHKLTQLMNTEGQIRASEGEVLKGTNHTPKVNGIR